jgi:hypothetical protein
LCEAVTGASGAAATLRCLAARDRAVLARRAAPGSNRGRAARRVLELEHDAATPWRQTASWALGYALYLSSRTSEAQAAAEDALAMAVAVPVRTTLVRSLALLGLIAHDRGDDDDAERLGRRAPELVEESGLTDSPVVPTHFLAASGWGHGDLEGALAADERAFAGQRYPVERFHALVEFLPARHASGIVRVWPHSSPRPPDWRLLAST